MVHYDAGDDGPYSNHPRVISTTIHSKPPDNVQGTDLLYCFEGGTGAVYGVNSDKQYASWSMMGFVLATAGAPTTMGSAEYDVYVVFRGSHGGKLDPQKLYAKSTDGTGNPDLVTGSQCQDVVEDPENKQVWPRFKRIHGEHKIHASDCREMSSKHSCRQKAEAEDHLCHRA
jgi:hypothetical protein